jgi:hypothetical protein
MPSFVALYRGATIAEAEFVAASSDPELVSEVAARLLDGRRRPWDPVLAAKDEGRRRALRLVGAEARGELVEAGGGGDGADIT